mgnify:CR=1 FL=1
MAIKATKIRLKSDASGNDEKEIRQIYLSGDGWTGWRNVSTVVRLLNDGNEITVDKHPNTYLVVVNSNPDYVRSVANGSKSDNLLKLPQD